MTQVDGSHIINRRFAVAENVTVEIGGKSKYEVAYNMAANITNIEKKQPANRQEY